MDVRQAAPIAARGGRHRRTALPGEVASRLTAISCRGNTNTFAGWRSERPLPSREADGERPCELANLPAADGVGYLVVVCAHAGWQVSCATCSRGAAGNRRLGTFQPALWALAAPVAARARRRYDVMFRHNTFTGRRTLWLDNRVIFQSGLRYRCVSCPVARQACCPGSPWCSARGLLRQRDSSRRLACRDCPQAHRERRLCAGGRLARAGDDLRRTAP